MNDLTVVHPARVVGTNVVHLARFVLADPADVASVTQLRALCPGAAFVTALELVPEEAPTLILCPACRSWLFEVNPDGLKVLLRRAKLAH